ncbi:MAG TPA: diaminopimelate epimerase [Gemmatimonadales bacterium]|jgi:diaminopimelate epimerase
MTVVFHKMTGSGNDFIMIDGRTSSPGDWITARIAGICDRRDGVGGDGLVFVTPAGPDAVRMTYFNSDGSPAPMCGNAALCSTRLAARLEMADPAGMTLVTDAATFATRCVGTGHLAELHLPDAPAPRPIDTAIKPGEHWVRLGVVGVPHAIVLVDDVAAVDVSGRGRELRFDPACGADGANVNFLSRTSPSSRSEGAPDTPHWTVRTYERGIEAETLSCGTGTVAGALALADLGLDALPLEFRSASGRILAVNATVADGCGVAIWLRGEGRVVARGVWLS